MDNNSKVILTLGQLKRLVKEAKQYKMKKLHESSTSVFAQFFDKYIDQQAKELINAYDINEAQGRHCDAWIDSGEAVNGERDDRDGFWSYNDGTVRRIWQSTIYEVEMSGCADEKISKEWEWFEKSCKEDYERECDRKGIEPDFSSEEYHEYEEMYFLDGDSTIYAEVEVFLNSYNGEYELVAHIDRCFESYYGRNFKHEFEMSMPITEDNLNEQAAQKFLREFAKWLFQYKFSMGKKDVVVQV